VGADTEKEREPNWRLVRGTWRSLDVEERKSLDVEERKALVGTYGHNCSAGQGKVVAQFLRL